ncbi:MAG TPA: hypothetical protein VLA72_15830 [Anaerolineales bacterium]|nr:hypothetical protein [Anaerolineales bacterium]
MDNKPSFDRELILPILLGGLSVIGIGVVFMWGSLSNARQTISAPDTETPLRFVYLGTEPGLSTLTPEATNTPLPTVTELVLPPPGPLASPSITSTSLVLPTGPPPRTATPTPSATISSVLSKIDDTYFELLYDGDWVDQSNVTDTYQNTLHISFTVGNSVSYTFTGQQIIVSFQAGPSLGRIGINLDGLLFEVDQESSNTELVDWQSAVLVWGTHTLVISHISGGSVNLDSITIPAVSTPTPTATVTETSTP